MNAVWQLANYLGQNKLDFYFLNQNTFQIN